MYIGEKEIKKIDGQTVTFTDDTVISYNKKELDYLKSDESRDLSQLRDALYEAMFPEIIDCINKNKEEDKQIKEVLNVFEEYNIKKSDIDFILPQIVQHYQNIVRGIADSYNKNLMVAIGHAIGTYEKDKHHSYFYENIKMSDIKKFI